MVAKILEAKRKVKPVIHLEEESCRFGPGEPRVSTERWHVPIGIGGAPMVIKSSALEDGEPGQNKIPASPEQSWTWLHTRSTSRPLKP